MIEINNLVKKYGEHVAVDNVSFTVEEGQIYGLLGPNGAGKSTTMNILTGYLGATSGEVKINGYDIFKQPEEAKKCIGYLPEQPPVYVDMTVKEYLVFAAQLKKLEKDKRKEYIAQAMELTKITDIENRLIKNLSKGYKQRVGLAQALLGFPKIIILDEPTVGLDPKQIIEIRDLIKNLGKKHTVILSSHILSEVSAVCDHIFIISKGHLVASDTPENLSMLLQGAHMLTMTVKGSEADVLAILDSIEQITSLEIHSAIERGTVTVCVKSEKDVDLREEIFFAMAEKRLPILEMQMAKKSLEDVFLQLTEAEVIEDTEAIKTEAIEGTEAIETKTAEVEDKNDDSNI